MGLILFQTMKSALFHLLAIQSLVYCYFLLWNGQVMPKNSSSKPADMWVYYLKNDPYPEVDQVTMLRTLFPDPLQYNLALSLVFEHFYEHLYMLGAVIKECLANGADIYVAHSLVQDKNLEHLAIS